jgi:hypothetical protein
MRQLSPHSCQHQVYAEMDDLEPHLFPLVIIARLRAALSLIKDAIEIKKDKPMI